MKDETTKKQLSVEQQLDDIYFYVDWLGVAEDYMDHGAKWLHDRMRGQTREGEPVAFTPEERRQLRGALCDISERIRRAADRLAE